MLEKLAKQTAVYGISTIVVRFLSYLLTPYYTRVFGQETYGVVTDIYALIPLALTLLTMGMESSYFRFSAKAEEAGGDVKAAKRRLFATTWGVTSLAAETGSQPSMQEVKQLVIRELATALQCEITSGS